METMQGRGMLEDREKLTRTFFDSMPQLGWYAQPDGFVDFYNRQFYDYTGCDLKELQGWGWKILVDPEAFPSVLERWKNSLATFEKFEMKIPLRRHDGVFRWFLTRVTPLFDEKGNCVRWVGINTDIQEEIDQAGALAQSERQFRMLADSLPDLVWITDNNLNCRYLNQRWIDYAGLTASAEYGLAWRNSIHPDDLQEVEELWLDCNAANRPFESEHRLRSSAGSYRWFLVRGMPVVDDQHNATSWFGTCTDIHLKKQANEELEVLARDRGQQLASVEALNESVIESIAEGIVIADPEGKLTYLNTAARDMLQNQAAPVSLQAAAGNGRNYDSSGERLLSAEELPLSKALAGQFVNDAEMMLISSNGHRRVVSVSARPIIDKSGQFKGAVAVVRDITARKASEIALQHARDEAVAASKIKSQFLANMSHEIRTPMSGILTLSEVLYTTTEGEPKELAGTILSSGRVLMKLLNDLMDLSKAEAGKISALEEEICLDELLDDACSTYYASALKKQIKLAMSFDERLPKKVYGDGRLIGQILQNLIHNAIKFTDAGSVMVKAELLSRDSNKIRVNFSVQDTGIGISDENQKKLFQLFVQVDGTTTRRQEGSGLGLALCKRLAEALSGEIEVESEEGKGSKFSLKLSLSTSATKGPA